MSHTHLDDPKYSTNDLLNIIKHLADFPYAQICRHLAMEPLITLIEREKAIPFEMLDALAYSAVRSNDEGIIECIKAIRRDA